MNQHGTDAHLDDDAFEESPPASNGAGPNLTPLPPYEFQPGEGEDEEEEVKPRSSGKEAVAGKDNTNRKRTLIVLAVGLLAVGVIGWFLWKMSFSANAFRAPVPAEPIDVAEKEGNHKQQPTDYADEEQMRTMDYGNVNSIYGLALKQQQANRQTAAKDSAKLNPSVQREIARSQQLTQQRQTYRRTTPSSYQTSGQDRYQSSANGYGSTGSTYGGRGSAYGDPYRTAPTREDLLLRAGFNTVKADGQTGNAYGGQQTLPPPSLATVEVEPNDPIPGVVSGDQTIMNGTRVMFRILADANIRDRFAPKGSILVGFAQLGGGRVLFNITTLRLSTGEAVPVRLRTLDMDMNEGLALQSDKPGKQQVDQATSSALGQAASQAAWSAGYGIGQAARVPVAGNALASLGTGLASAATTGRRREVRQKLSLQDGFRVFFVPVK